MTVPFMLLVLFALASSGTVHVIVASIWTTSTAAVFELFAYVPFPSYVTVTSSVPTLVVLNVSL